MSALHTSRRGLLRMGAVSAGIAVAGCADDSSADFDSETSTERFSDLETASIRGDPDAPLVRLPPDSDDGDGDGDDPDAEPESLLVLTESTAVDALEYDREGRSDDVRELLAATTFEAESALVYQARVSECYERRLEYVDAGTDRFDLQFCRVERDASVACEIDREQLQATFVRVPIAYEDEPSEWSVGGSSSCRTDVTSDDGDESEDEDGAASAEDDE
ncbi:hypothetical protein [Natronorubrum halophilum]|uniref:hypothetical protein n=1 Tax=Natronorubrum halophilum TaxID=1702106 RepID=UPI0010C1C36A|nr:hypothetical protein [Natronorubrum halophilum]